MLAPQGAQLSSGPSASLDRNIGRIIPRMHQPAEQIRRLDLVVDQGMAGLAGVETVDRRVVLVAAQLAMMEMGAAAGANRTPDLTFSA